MDIAQVIREELERQQERRQRLCPHVKSGTFLTDGVLACDDCAKPLSEADAQDGYTEELSMMEEQNIAINREWKG